MQPTPTPSLLSAASRSRAWTSSFHFAILLSLLALGACRDPKISAYRVPKETAQAAKAEPAHAHGDGHDHGEAKVPEGHPPIPSGSAEMSAGSQGGLATASGPGLAWTAPGSWEKRQGSMMRKATYAIVGEGGATADLAVTAFPGDVGGDVANVNRWRGQVGLPPVSEADAAAAIERFEANGLKIGVVDLVDKAAATPTHMLGAMVPYEGATWFFKLVGPDALVAKEKPSFLEFIKTIKPAEAATP